MFDPEGAYWTSGSGEWRCPSQADYRGGKSPCHNVDKGIKESDSVYRANLTWKATETAMLYATWSEGYRPGGVQRDPRAGDYLSDFLTNYELGWKTRLAGDRLQFNGAIFQEDWDNIQLAYQGLNGITQVENDPKAQIQGVEMQFDWLATETLRLSAAGAYYDTELKSDYVAICSGLPCVKNVKGAQLPVTAEFKGNLVARYSFPLGGFEAYTQGALAYEGSRLASLNAGDADIYGTIPSSTFVDRIYLDGGR